MPNICSAPRAVLLGLSLLSACAAADASSGFSGQSNRYGRTGAYGNYLAGRYALSQGDANTAANDLLKALAVTPNDRAIATQAFLACLHAGRPEVVRLARMLPDDDIAQLVLSDEDAKAGRWQSAEQRFHALPRRGLMQVLQPMLTAWALQGDGRAEAALATLRPFLDNPRFRGLFALQAGMIADIADRKDDAARFYRIAQAENPDSNFRQSEILASWQARSGNPVEAQKTLAAIATIAPEASISLPALVGNSGKRVVNRATDGIAEAYVTLASALRAQDAHDFALIMVRLALDLRPDLTTARLLGAELLGAQKQHDLALQLLNGVADGDPLAPIIRLRRTALFERLGRGDDAMRELQRLTRDFPDSPLPDTQLGDLLRTKLRYKEAVEAYNRAVGRIKHPVAADWLIYYNRGVASERAGDWQRAEADFHRALELSPDQPFVLNYLGYSWADMGRNLDRAMAMIEKAAIRRPNDGAILDSLGWVTFRQGGASKAVKILERAVELEPEDATITSHLGDVYWAVGRRVEAVYQWRRALNLNPPAEEAAKIEAKLNRNPADPLASGQ
jgi:tetratricopeptide (TPR) repeat protein